jgi:hypothetical protein
MKNMTERVEKLVKDVKWSEIFPEQKYRSEGPDKREQEEEDKPIHIRTQRRAHEL